MQVSQEADWLCRVIESRQDDLRATRLGKRSEIEDTRFTLIQADRNAVYRVSREHRWYLKMPRNPEKSAIDREKLGAEFAQEALKTFEDCHVPVIRVSRTASYSLYSEVPGRILNRSFYALSLLPTTRNRSRIEALFYNLGMAFGCIHGLSLSDDIPHSDRNIQTTITDCSKNTDVTDSLIQSGLSWASTLPADHDPPVFVHGNAKLENVLAIDNNICLIDFENCGLGSRYEDISWPISQLLLTQTLFAFPRSPTLIAMESFLRGYSERADFSIEALAKFVGLRMIHYFFLASQTGFRGMRIACMPVMQRRVRRLIQQFIAGDAETVLPAIAVYP